MAASNFDVSKLFDGKLALKGADVPVSQLAGKVVAIYFSAHWCPPCRAFTPTLIKAYEAAKAAGLPFELVFVSSDEDEEGFDEYTKDMPWPSVKFSVSRRHQQWRSGSLAGCFCRGSCFLMQRPFISPSSPACFRCAFVFRAVAGGGHSHSAGRAVRRARHSFSADHRQERKDHHHRWTHRYLQGEGGSDQGLVRALKRLHTLATPFFPVGEAPLSLLPAPFFLFFDDPSATFCVLLNGEGLAGLSM